MLLHTAPVAANAATKANGFESGFSLLLLRLSCVRKKSGYLVRHLSRSKNTLTTNARMTVLKTKEITPWANVASRMDRLETSTSAL